MSESIMKRKKYRVVSISILLFIITINPVYGKDIVFEKENSDAVIVFTDEGKIVSSMDVTDIHDGSYTPVPGEDLIVEYSGGTKLTFSEEQLHVTNELKDQQLCNEPASTLKFIHESNQQCAKVAIEQNGDLYVADEVIDDITGGKQVNYIRTKLYQNGNDKNPITTTSYSDGLGRVIQNHKKLDAANSIVSGTYYDVLGRPVKNTKLAPLLSLNQFYIMASNKLVDDINDYYGATEEHAFSESVFDQDPLSRVRETGAPGLIYSLEEDHHPKFWYFGVVNENGFIPSTSNGPIWESTLNNMENEDNARYFLTIAKDANGNFTQEIKDIFGSVVNTWTHSGKPNDDITSQYIYDISGNVIEEIPPLGDVYKTTYEYNKVGQLINMTTPDAGITTYEYNDLGLLSLETKAKGTTDHIILYYFYDELQRLTAITQHKPQGVPSPRISKYYDTIKSIEQDLSPIENLSTILAELKNLKGNLVADINHNSNVIGDDVVDLYSYNDEGYIFAKYKYVPGLHWQKIEYNEYDLQGKLKKSTIHPNYLSNGNFTPIIKEYNYDNFGKLSTVKVNGKGFVTYEYSKTGLLEKRTFYNISTSSKVIDVEYQYNIRNWIDRIEAKDNSSVTQFYENLDYTNQYNGNITGTDYYYRSIGSEINLDYSYDRVNRLTSVQANSGFKKYSEAFSYDKMGRISQKRRGEDNFEYFYENYIYKTINNQLRHITEKQVDDNYIYDLHGNMIKDLSKNIKTIDYNWANLPYFFEFTNDDESWNSEVKMAYDASNNRVLKTNYQFTPPTKSIAYIDNEMVFKNTDIGDQEEKYELKYVAINSPEGIEGKINYAQGNVANAYYYTKDHLGSVRSVIADDGSLVRADMYYAYGEISPVIISDHVREKFTGKELDEEGRESRKISCKLSVNVPVGSIIEIHDGRRHAYLTLRYNLNTQDEFSKQIYFTTIELTDTRLTLYLDEKIPKGRIDQIILGVFGHVGGLGVSGGILYCTRTNIDIEDGSELVVSFKDHIVNSNDIPFNFGSPSENIFELTVGDVTGISGIGLFYFGARYYDSQIASWTSVDPISQFASPYLYTGIGINPIIGKDKDGKRVDIFIYLPRDRKLGGPEGSGVGRFEVFWDGKSKLNGRILGRGARGKKYRNSFIKKGDHPAGIKQVTGILFERKTPEERRAFGYATIRLKAIRGPAAETEVLKMSKHDQKTKALNRKYLYAHGGMYLSEGEDISKAFEAFQKLTGTFGCLRGHNIDIGFMAGVCYLDKDFTGKDDQYFYVVVPYLDMKTGKEYIPEDLIEEYSKMKDVNVLDSQLELDKFKDWVNELAKEFKIDVK